MPLEIKELYIKLTVNATEGNSTPQPIGGASTMSGSTQQAAGNEAIIAECVEQVLYILQQKYER